MDNITKQRIQTLHPSVRTEMELIVNECNKALSSTSQVRITQALRTIKEQDALYAQGRTAPGKVVTNAKGGTSNHNYGFAVDIVLIIDGKTASWDVKKDWDKDGLSDWDECVKIFAKHGWTWGGNFVTFKDMPHFEKIGFNNWRVLSKKKLGVDGYIVI
jgi:peptidoglycan L-alanyl-D-glutamate endopeptidase CwlK